MRAMLIAILALAACRQALGIPASGQVEGEAQGFGVIAAVSGAEGASGGATATVNGLTQPLVDGMNRIEAGLDDGATFTVTASANCHVMNGQGTIDGQDATGVVIACDGLAALASFGFSAPITFSPAFDGTTDNTAASASFLVQETSFLPIAKHPDATITRVDANGAAAQPTGGPYGPYSFASSTSFDVEVMGSGYTRTYRATATVAAPGVFGYGKPSATADEAWFGDAVAAWGDLLVVGAPNVGEGRAFVYRRTGTTWVEEQELTAAGLQDGDRFGASVAVYGSTIVVGAPGPDTRPGAAYVFTESNHTWAAGPALTPSGATAGDQFGAAVARSDAWTIIGAPGCKVASVSTGCVYKLGASGGLTQIPIGATHAGDRVGAAVAISGTTVVVGAPGESSSSPTDRNNGDFPAAGAAYYLPVTGGAETYLKAPVPGEGDQFGAAVAIDGQLVVIGAPLEDSAGTNLTADPNDNSAIGAGAVYVFPTDGSPGVYVKAPNTGTGDNFGRSVAIHKAVIAVGAPFEDSATTSMSDNASRDAGAIYAYPISLSGTVPTLGTVAYLKTTSEEAGDHLGASVALTTDSLIAGAPLEDSSATGWNGAANEESLDSGAVFTFR